MCGIAGAFSSGRWAQAEAMVRNIVASQHRRGPDHQAVECIRGGRTHVVMGHNRLSIIDLSSLANQPMWDSDRRFCLVYNGEIYNYLELRAELSSLGHRFFSRSDSEVIIEAFKEWGLGALDRLNGMFAFALYDCEKERMWLVRDRFGVKPLYYYFHENTLLFASTGKTIAECQGLQPDLDYAARGLVYGIYDDDTEISPYQGLKALRPGHWLQLGLTPSGRLSVDLHPYYDLADRVTRIKEAVAEHSPSDLTQMVADRLRDAVAIRLRSDVPMGISLSGGLDSATLAGYLARCHDDITGFTFGSPDEDTSEGPVVREMSKRTKIGVHFVWPRPAAFVEAFWDAMEAQDGPFPGPSIVAQYLVFKAASACGIKVLLGGQGGDELFMGYRKFQLFRFLELAYRGRWVDALATAVGIGSVLLAESYKILDYLGHLERYRGGRRRQGALRLPDPSPLKIGYDPALPLWERQLHDVTRYSLPTLLRYEDRNSMGNSVESRLPYLDYRLVELALALPTGLKLRRGYGKWIVRQGTGGMVLDRIRWARYKRPFDVSLKRWVEQGLGESIRVRLHGIAARVREFLAPGTAIDDAWSDAQLLGRPSTLAEAVTLIWLGERIK